jgi:hypothetical protein
MEYLIEDHRLVLNFNAANNGRFKFKKRGTDISFGKSFSTRECQFDNEVYLEWQIGYDEVMTKEEIANEEGNSSELGDHDIRGFFVGANGKTKKPYELSKLLFSSLLIGLISRDELIFLLEEVESYNSFIDEREIRLDNPEEIRINNIIFKETSIRLPAFFMVDSTDGTQVEIHIKQQQYASGTQPMVYFCIPFRSFSNHQNLIGRCSVVGDELVYSIDNNNISVLLSLVKVFAMCSNAHNHDIKEILKLLINQIEC